MVKSYCQVRWGKWRKVGLMISDHGHPLMIKHRTFLWAFEYDNYWVFFRCHVWFPEGKSKWMTSFRTQIFCDIVWPFPTKTNSAEKNTCQAEVDILRLAGAHRLCCARRGSIHYGRRYRTSNVQRESSSWRRCFTATCGKPSRNSTEVGTDPELHCSWLLCLSPWWHLAYLGITWHQFAIGYRWL